MMYKYLCMHIKEKINTFLSYYYKQFLLKFISFHENIFLYHFSSVFHLSLKADNNIIHNLSFFQTFGIGIEKL